MGAEGGVGVRAAPGAAAAACGLTGTGVGFVSTFGSGLGSGSFLGTDEGVGVGADTGAGATETAGFATVPPPPHRLNKSVALTSELAFLFSFFGGFCPAPLSCEGCGTLGSSAIFKV